MKVLFVHQNFPGQFKHLAPALAQNPNNQIVAIGEQDNVSKYQLNLPNFKMLGYPKPNGANASTHHYIRGLESAVRRGQSCLRLALQLKQQGFIPDIIVAHPGWGDSLFLKDIFPQSKILHFFEFYYRSTGSDVNFDPEFPSELDDLFRVRIKNSTNLFSIEIADWGLSPTQWQCNQFPDDIRKKISVIHDGVDTDVIKPNDQASITVSNQNKQIILTKNDEVITFVNRNLEPYRGFHSFLRAIPKIQKLRPNAHIIIVGGDDVSYGRRLENNQTYKAKYLAEVGSQIDLSKVHFVGRIPYPVFLQMLQISSAHVYLTYPFVLSWSMIEAMATECLVIGSKTPPVQEVIEDHKNGLLVDFFDTENIANTIHYALENPEKMAQIRKNARQTVLQRYDLKRVCLPQQLELINALVQGKTPNQHQRQINSNNNSIPSLKQIMSTKPKRKRT